MIIGMKRLEETTIRAGGDGDNWRMTWASDDRQYAGLCDGPGWPNLAGYTGAYYNSRLYAIRGDPPDMAFEHLPGYPDLVSVGGTLQCHRYYGFGVIALGDAIYHYLSTPNHMFDLPSPRFVGAKLIYSPDLGRTWCNQDGSPIRWEPWEERSRANMAFFEEEGDSFALLTVLQMGKRYRDNNDGYVYVYAPNGSVDGRMNELVMFRVPKERLLDRSAYEFFVVRTADGGARWSADIRDRGVVAHFPAGWVNTWLHPYAWQPSVVYNAPLGVYLMANWGMGCAPDGAWFGKLSYLGFWVAPQPWGPWEQVHEETAWMPAGDAAARAYSPEIAPKWIAPDGRSFWLVWTDFQEIGGRRPYYAFNVQKVIIETR